MRAAGSGTQYIRQIDTGFPIDWRTLRDDVGEDVEIMGGVEVLQ